MENKIVIKSRVRLARNLVDYPFPNRLDEEKSLEVIEKVKEALFKDNSGLEREYDFYKMADLSQLKKICMVEKHLISPDLASNVNGAVLIKKDETVSIMINEEDHIRIQTMCDGLELEKAYQIANKIDDFLEETLEYAFDVELGYLTSCPTNTGTGMRASVMFHLPALTQLRYINDVYKVSSQIGVAVRGIYGERTEALGNIYQISNQLTLGRTEKNTIENIKGMATDIVSKELQAREMIKKTWGIKLEDKIFRALGLLEGARIIDTSEAMGYLSVVKVGVEMGYIENIKLDDLDKLMINIQPAHQSTMFENAERKDRDINRAKYIRETLEKLKVGGANYELQ